LDLRGLMQKKFTYSFNVF